MSTEATSSSPAASQPPLLVALICWLGFIGGIGGFVIALQVEQYRLIGAWVPPAMALLSVLELFTFIHIWQMRRWAVKMHAALFAAGIALSLAIGGGQHAAALALSITLNIFFIGYLFKAVK